MHVAINEDLNLEFVGLVMRMQCENAYSYMIFATCALRTERKIAACVLRSPHDRMQVLKIVPYIW